MGKRARVPAKRLFIKFLELYSQGISVLEVAKKLSRSTTLSEQSLSRMLYVNRFHKIANAILDKKLTIEEIPAKATGKWFRRKAAELYPEDDVPEDPLIPDAKTEYDPDWDFTEKSLETLSLTWIVGQIRQLYELEENNRNKVDMLRFLTSIADKYNEELKSDLAQIKNMSLRDLVKMVGDLIREMGENEILANTIKMLAEQLQTPEDVIKKQIEEN